MIKLEFIIPTKNRWHLLQPTLDSLVKQTCNKFTVLIVDNSDTPDQENISKEILKSYEKFLNIRCIKTGNLNMLENWNKGYELSNGEYSYLVTDKIILDSNAVALFYDGLQQFPNEKIFMFGKNDKKNKKWRMINSSTLINESLDDMENFVNACIGSELKCFLKKEYKDFLIKKYGKLINFVGGDVDVVYMAIMNNPTYCQLDYNIIKNRNNLVGSVGRSGEYGGEIYRVYLKEHGLDYNNLYPFAPINISDNFNGLYNDFFATAKLSNYPCSYEDLNKTKYIINIYSSLVYYQRLYNVSKSEDFEKLHNYIEKNNLQFNPDINECFRYYANSFKSLNFKDFKKINTHKKLNIFGIKISWKSRKR